MKATTITNTIAKKCRKWIWSVTPNSPFRNDCTGSSNEKTSRKNSTGPPTSPALAANAETVLLSIPSKITASIGPKNVALILCR